MDIISIVKLSSTASKSAIAEFAETLIDRGVGIEKAGFTCLNVTNPMSGKTSGIHTPHNNYIVHIYCYCLALCFKH